MLAVSALQGICAATSVYFGAKAAMGFGRDLRGAIFGRVLAFSARELNSFGAPSLITRNTNDVQQVQMLVLMSCTMHGLGADHHGWRRHHGRARRCRAVLAAGGGGAAA